MKRRRQKSHLGKTEKKELAELFKSKGLPADALPLSFLGGPFVLTDPSQPDSPIVFASKSFAALTGYDRKEIVGRNCRFLQDGGGPRDVEGAGKIRRLIEAEEEGVVRIRNYTKNGREFINTFFLHPLKHKGKTVLFFGGQCADRIMEGEEDPATVEPIVPSHLRYRASSSGDYQSPNTGIVSEFTNKWAQGSVLIKTRTDPLDGRVAEYFGERNRMFEYQVQFELLEPIPDDYEIFIGAEIDAPLQLGYASRFIVGALLRILNLFNGSLHHAHGDKDDGEPAHLTFPFNVLPDNLSRVKKGKQAPPSLTLKELPNLGKQTFDGLETGYIYTLSFYSQYVDFENWNIVRAPGMRNVSLRTFWAESPLHVVAYALPRDEAQGAHIRDHRRTLLDVELTHDSLQGFPQ